MKKILRVSLAILCFLLSGCAAGNGGQIETDGNTEIPLAVSESVASETPTVTATSTERETEEPMQTEEQNTIIQRNTITDRDYLKASGKNLRNNNGNGDIVNLRGTNVGGWLLQEFWMTPTAYSGKVSSEIDIYEYLAEKYGKEKMHELVELYQSNYWTEKDFDNCAAMGMNCLRLPFWYRNIVDENGEFYEDWYKLFDWFIEEAGKRGMYVILDMHGAPGSQNGSDHSGADGGDEKEANSKFFFGDEEIVHNNQELFYKIWETVAEHYKGNPVVAGYDLLNEPYCTYRYNSKLSADQLHEILWNVYDTAYNKIRAIDPNHVIIMEATWDPSDLPKPSQFGWENIMYEYHNYLYDDYDNANKQQINNMRKKINLIRAAAYDVPSYMGEFSYFRNLDAWDEGLKILNAYGINWTTWTYKVMAKNGNWGLYHQSLSPVNIETAASEADIANTWSKSGNSFANKDLVDVVTNYINAPVVENDLK